GTSTEVGIRMTSGGVSFSLPGQKGQLATNDATGFRSRLLAISSGRRARSVAITTHSLVAKFWRSSDIVTPCRLRKKSVPAPQAHLGRCSADTFGTTYGTTESRALPKSRLNQSFFAACKADSDNQP